MCKDWKKELEEYIARIAKKQHISDKFLIAVASDEFKAKRSAIQKGKPAHNKGKPSPLKGRPAHNKGILQSEETKAKRSAATKGRPGVPQPKLTCPHCGLEGGDRAMKRSHMDNCKLKRD
jgi:hypothetical protein